MIRPAEETDAQSIAMIFNHYIADSDATFEEVAVSVDEMQKRLNNVQADGLPWLIAEDAGKVIGYAYASQWSEKPSYRHSVELTVYISPDQVSKGWGRKLYQALFTQVKQLGFRTALAGITLPHPASIALHEKFGMTKVAHYKDIGYKFGRWCDVGYWQIVFDEQS